MFSNVLSRLLPLQNNHTTAHHLQRPAGNTHGGNNGRHTGEPALYDRPSHDAKYETIHCTILTKCHLQQGHTLTVCCYSVLQT